MIFFYQITSQMLSWKLHSLITYSLDQFRPHYLYTCSSESSSEGSAVCRERV